MLDMKRREFIALLGGGAAAAWPLAARAQQSEPMRRIGVFMPLAADDPESLARVGAFLQGAMRAILPTLRVAPTKSGARRPFHPGCALV